MAPEAELAAAIIVTGTGIARDRVLASAALAAGLGQEGVGVHVVTVVHTEPGPENLLRVDDLFEVPSLQLIRLPGQAPPVPGAQRAGVHLPDVAAHASRIAALARDDAVDFILLDDPHGLLVPLDDDGSTLLDLADLLDALSVRVGAVVAVSPHRDGLGVASMTCAMLDEAGVDVLGLVGAGWPDAGDEVSDMLSSYLPETTGRPWLGSVPAQAAVWTRRDFTAHAASWLPIR